MSHCAHHVWFVMGSDSRSVKWGQWDAYVKRIKCRRCAEERTVLAGFAERLGWREPSRADQGSWR